MPYPKKKLVKNDWLEKLGSYPIFSIPLKNWLLIGAFLGCIFGFIGFTIYQEVSHPAAVETLMAEVNKIWIEQHDSDTGGVRVYRVRLKREDDEEMICIVPSIKIGIWQGLEIGTKYRFSVSRTARGCYINEAVKIEEQE
jgi:hypothetical protein